MTTILRRKGLGKASVKGIATNSRYPITTVRNDAELEHDSVWARWGCTSTIPDPYYKVINTAEAIHRVADKRGFRGLLNESGICPRTWFTETIVPLAYFPVILRARTHHQGKDLWYCETRLVLQQHIEENNLRQRGYYISEYIPKIAEFRVFCMQGRVVWMCLKNIEDKAQVAWNHGEGSVFENVRWGSWNLDVARVALEAMELSGLHFGGVDVILSKDFKPYVLEINSAPSLPSPYRQSCVARALDLMLNTGDYDVQAFKPETISGWRDAIHPAIWSKE